MIYYGSNTTNKRGIDAQNLTNSSGSTTFNNCAFREATGSGAYIGTGVGNGSFITITNNVIHTSGSTTGGINIGIGTGTLTAVFTLSDNLIVGGTSATGITLNSFTNSGTISGNRIVGVNTAMIISTSAAVNGVTNISGHIHHTCGNTGLSFSGSAYKIITSCTFVSCGTGVLGASGTTVFESCNFIGNTTTGFQNQMPGTNYPSKTIFNSCTFRGRTSFNQGYGVYSNSIFSAAAVCEFNNCTFGSSVAHTNADIGFVALQDSKYYFNSCTLSSSTEITSTTYAFLEDSGLVSIIRKDDTDGNHLMHIKYAIVTPDTTIYRTASPSIRIAPKSATIEANSKLFAFKVPINNGQTATPSIYVRESVVGDGTDYNGNRIKLYVAKNVNLGISSDTLLDTATGSSEGAWEQLTGTTSAVTDDGVLEFYITCDGTTGWINYDDIIVTLS